MVIAIPFLFALLGCVTYLAASNAKAAELGRCAWWVGLLVGLLNFGHAAVSVLR